MNEHLTKSVAKEPRKRRKLFQLETQLDTPWLALSRSFPLTGKPSHQWPGRAPGRPFRPRPESDAGRPKTSKSPPPRKRESKAPEKNREKGPSRARVARHGLGFAGFDPQRSNAFAFSPACRLAGRSAVAEPFSTRKIGER